MPGRASVKLGSNANQEANLLKGFSIMTRLEGAGIYAHVARLIVTSGGAYIEYTGERYGFHFVCDQLGYQILRGVAQAGDLTFGKV
jgi:hypothetical protein